jgi:hypothetical protein
MRFFWLLTLTIGSFAFGQTTPDEDWNRYPTTPPGPAPWSVPVAPPVSPPPLAMPPPGPIAIPTVSPPVPRRLLEPNTVSMYGANTLGRWKRSESISLGFPLIAVRFSLGLADRVDVGAAFETVYTLLNEIRGTVRVRLTDGTRGNWMVAFAFEGGGALYRTRASREVRGSRWITGRRNFNFVPGLVVSREASSLRSTRFFCSLRYMLALDTEPFVRDPLEGVPPPFRIGHNGMFTVGAEAPIDEATSFLLSAGLEFHGDPRDAPVMPTISLGMVFGL